jgi:hypothetical protein
VALIDAIVLRKGLQFVANGQASRCNLSIKGTSTAAFLLTWPLLIAHLHRLSEKPRHSRLNSNTAAKLPIISDPPDCYDGSQVVVSQGPTPKAQRINGCRNGLPWEHHNETFHADIFADGGAFILYHECGDEEFPLSHVRSLSSQRHLASTSILIESMNRLLYEPSPENLPGWQRRLLSHCAFFKAT